MEQKLRDIIAAHNRMIETIQNAEMTCNLFRGMEVWHKIACEGADIVSAARSIGIDAKIDMQSGVITVNKEDNILSHDADVPCETTNPLCQVSADLTADDLKALRGQRLSDAYVIVATMQESSKIVNAANGWFLLFKSLNFEDYGKTWLAYRRKPRQRRCDHERLEHS